LLCRKIQWTFRRIIAFHLVGKLSRLRRPASAKATASQGLRRGRLGTREWGPWGGHLLPPPT
jgi:hypothetical protein